MSDEAPPGRSGFRLRLTALGAAMSSVAGREFGIIAGWATVAIEPRFADTVHGVILGDCERRMASFSLPHDRTESAKLDR